MISQDVETDLYATLEAANLSGVVQVFDGQALADYLDDVGKCGPAAALRWMMDNCKMPGRYSAMLVGNRKWIKDWNWLYAGEEGMKTPSNQKRKQELLPEGLFALLPPSTAGTLQPEDDETWEDGDALWRSYATFREACEALYSAFTLWEGEES